MVALAEGVSDGIETLAIGWNTDVAVTEATDGKGATVSNPNAATFAKGSGKFLVPVRIENSGTETYVDPNVYTLTYYTVATGGSPVATKNATLDTATGYFEANKNAVDTYYVEIAKGTETTTNRIAFKVVESQSLDGIYAYVGNDSSNKDIVYSGDILNDATGDFISFAYADGTKVTPDTGSLTWKRGNGEAIGVGQTLQYVRVAGDYVASFEVDDTPVNVEFTVQPLDLSKVSVSFPDTVNDTPVNTDADFLSGITVNGIEGTDNIANAKTLASILKVDSIKASDGSANWGVEGPYTVKVSVDEDELAAVSAAYKGSVIGSAEVSFSYLDEDAIADGQLLYGNRELEETPAGSKEYNYTVSLLDGESFDSSKIKVVYDGVTYTGDDLELSYAKDGKAVDASELAKQGDYVVGVRVKPFQTFADDLWVGGSASIKVKVSGTEIDADKNLAFYFDGELSGNGAKPTYDGTDQLERLEIVLKDSDGNALVEGTDYEVEVENVETGKTVTEAIDAGQYKVTVKPLTFGDAGGTWSFDLDVQQVDLSTLVADVTDTMNAAAADGDLEPESNEFYVPYTGSAVQTPGVKYEVVKGAGADAEYSYVTLDPSLYNVVSIKQGTKTVTEAVDEDDYTVTIALTDAAKENYKPGTGNMQFAFTVRAYGQFSDVAPDAWYAVPVEKAWANYYVNGIAGTDLYAPNAEITRADVACILFNMAGGNIDNGRPVVGNDEFSFSDINGYITGFSDVDGHAYYAKAIAWAHASGVVNGHDGEFRPMDKITREEFASMLANFAKVKGDYKASDGSALAGLSDAASVSDWAEANVAWAVDAGVMGNNGSVMGQNQITRGEVAAMAVNYQPEPIVKITVPRV